MDLLSWNFQNNLRTSYDDILRVVKASVTRVLEKITQFLDKLAKTVGKKKNSRYLR
jgi:hypothetical protein